MLGDLAHCACNDAARRNGLRGNLFLHRYLAEFEFRYNNRVKPGVNDEERAAKALKGIEGKRLTYRPADETAYA